MASENIFSGLKVLDLASFIAGPSAAVILSDFGAEVIKVEPPAATCGGMGIRSHRNPRRPEPYPWHLANRNKRGMTLDMKSACSRPVLERLVRWADVVIVNTPTPGAQTAEARVRRSGAVELTPDLRGRHRLWGKGAGLESSGLRYHGVLGSERLAIHDPDAGAPPTWRWPAAGTTPRPSASMRAS